MTADVIIIGGGAAGLVAGIVSARNGRKVVILEMGERVGKKLLSTGNGKCNLANRTRMEHAYNTPFATEIVTRIGEENIEKFFEELGVPLRADEEGRVYPYSALASCVLNVLREKAEDLGVRIETGVEVKQLIEGKNGWRVGAESATSVVWASGSAATFGTDSLHVLRAIGLEVRSFVPSLAPLLADVSDLSGLRGVKFRAEVELVNSAGDKVARENGEILVKDNGLSGIAIFNLSAVMARLASSHYTLAIDFFPDFAIEELSAYLTRSSSGVAHKELIRNAVRRIGTSDPTKLATVLKQYKVEVKGLSHFSLAQASSGGVATLELDADLQVRKHAGLYIIGEAVDVDGLSGGYNLMWAWASAMVAGAKA